MSTTLSTQNSGVATSIPQQTGIKSLSNFLNGDAIKNKFKEVLGDAGPTFVASIISACNLNNDLKNATQESIYSAALTAATLKLPINPNLGFAYLIPYKTKAGTPQEKVEASFQIGYKGLKQLAQRTGLYLRITESPVFEGQLVKEDPLLGFEFDWKIKASGKPIGYVSYFKLNNGFESTFYMTSEQMNAHAIKYSQTFKSKTQWVKDQSKWSTDFDAMALKTVTKLNLSKNGPLSVEMQKALISDQAVINNVDTDDVTYVDNTPDPVDLDAINAKVEHDRIAEFIAKAESRIEIESLQEFCTSPELKALLEEKSKTIK